MTALREVMARLDEVVLGKRSQIRLALTCLLARGHLLIEDIPGIGKTTLAKSLATVLGLDFRRVQFTTDLLPGDVLGVSVFDASSSSFVFHPGPVFTNVLLADEINRGTPRVQSALLEVMEERQVSLDSETRPLPRPFFVLATQNALDQAGTYPLPESQLDRFLFRIGLGYPDMESELELLERSQNAGRPLLPDALMNMEQVLALQDEADQVRTTRPLLRYVRDLLDWTRTGKRFGAYPAGVRGDAPCGAGRTAFGRRGQTQPDKNQRQRDRPRPSRPLLQPDSGRCHPRGID